MTATLLISIVFTAIVIVVAVMMWQKSHRLQGEVASLKYELKGAEFENSFLKEEVARLTRQRGIDELAVLSIAMEISRMENNLSHMDDVPGRKQVLKAIERMKGVLQAEDYTIVPLLGRPYVEGMMATVVFVPDESLEKGASVILSVKKPQVNYRGNMIQAASITVGQNIS